MGTGLLPAVDGKSIIGVHCIRYGVPCPHEIPLGAPFQCAAQQKLSYPGHPCAGRCKLPPGTQMRSARSVHGGASNAWKVDPDGTHPGYSDLCPFLNIVEPRRTRFRAAAHSKSTPPQASAGVRSAFACHPGFEAGPRVMMYVSQDGNMLVWPMFFPTECAQLVTKLQFSDSQIADRIPLQRSDPLHLGIKLKIATS